MLDVSCGFQSQLTLKTIHEAAMAKVDELSAQLKDERLKSLDLKRQLQSSSISKRRTEQVNILFTPVPWSQEKTPEDKPFLCCCSAGGDNQ